eukprot:CAMPEP_0202454910 /NCGR_PEP_ID=MMETSP1360-20130828/12549_1 /ASSEMBLY_ACC=CAM_ASM_000848 /TAXON_ID=515479 /ORGANISM="Licmophora paradoxa, Strain CCMP2313" /LENGTH=132 /DNA_ID=CAMNT_0049074345 /DNA_START=658 /DNA_END=1056 /DNA_ORIENTATION=-
MKNNSAAAKGKGYPLKIIATEVRVDDPQSNDDNNNNDDDERQIAFTKSILSVLDWSVLVEAAGAMGLTTLPPVLTEEMSDDEQFLRALYHVLMNVRLIKGVLTCPLTGREFPVTDGIPNFMLEEEECESVRM